MSTGSPSAFRGPVYATSGLSHENSFAVPTSSPTIMHAPPPHSTVGIMRPSPPMGSSLSPGMAASVDPTSPLATTGVPSATFLPSRSFDRPTVVSNQYYIPAGEEVRPVPLGQEPSLGMQPTYRTDRVRTFEAKMFYDTRGGTATQKEQNLAQNGHRRDRLRHHREDNGQPGRHCSRCLHGYDDDGDETQSTSDYSTDSYTDHSSSATSQYTGRHERPRCRDCRREQRKGHHRSLSKHGHRRHRSSRSGSKNRLSTRPSSGPDYSRDRHHRRSYRGPSSEGTSSGRHRASRAMSSKRHTHTGLSDSESRGRSWSSRRRSSLVVVVGHRITSANLHHLKNPLRRKVAAHVVHSKPHSHHQHRHPSTHRTHHHEPLSRSKKGHSKHGRGRDHSAPPSHKRSVKRRSGSTSSTSSSSSSSSASSRSSDASLCPYHAALRKKQSKKLQKRSRKSPHHNNNSHRHHRSSPQPHSVRQREAHSSVEDGSSTEQEEQTYFEPQTTHHYFHHYPELPSRKPNPFPSNTGTPLKRQGEEQGPGVAAVHHYPMSEKNAAKLKSGFPANPATAKAAYDRLKISTFEFEQPQDHE